MTIGIDKIGFATSQYVLKLQDLAEARGIDPEKLSKGLLLKELSIAPLTEDIVTLAASASDSILTEQERQEIDMVIVATESGIDQSKAAAFDSSNNGMYKYKDMQLEVIELNGSNSNSMRYLVFVFQFRIFSLDLSLGATNSLCNSRF